jgi:hypothetical protein
MFSEGYTSDFLYSAFSCQSLCKTGGLESLIKTAGVEELVYNAECNSSTFVFIVSNRPQDFTRVSSVLGRSAAVVDLLKEFGIQPFRRFLGKLIYR